MRRVSVNRKFILQLMIVVSIVVCGAGASTAAAQSRFAPEAVTISNSAFNYDLSGVGTTPSVSLTLDWPLTKNVVLEGGAVFARPQQRFGRTTYIIPESQVQYRWHLGRFSPFVGGGVGAALDFRHELLGGTQAKLALSTGGGLRAKLSKALGIGGELRLRGIGRDFGGSVAEIRSGLFWTF
jgi:hypothetical protein